MSTNDPHPSDEQQDADAAPDGNETGVAEETSTADTATADTTTETTEEGTAAEAAPDADSAADTEPDDAASAATSDSQATGPPTQFRAAINGGALKTALSTLSTLVDETRIHIDASGIQMRAVDPANVGMTDLTLEAAAFESYAATTGRLGVDLERLEDIVRMATADDLVQLALNQESGKLVIHIDDLEFTMACLDPDTIRADPDIPDPDIPDPDIPDPDIPDPDIPDLNLPAEVVVEGDDIDRAVTAADMVSEHITLGVDPDAAQFYATAQGDTDEVRLELDRDELVDMAADEVDSLYSLEYLADMNTAIPESAEVTVELGESFPLLLAYEFANGDGHVTQMLAPRIATE